MSCRRFITRALLPALVLTMTALALPATPAHAAIGNVTIGTASFPISGTNVYRAANSLVVYTPGGGTSTPTNIYGLEAVVVGGTVTRVSDRLVTGAAATAVPANGYVLSGHGSARDWLLARARVGAVVTVPGAAPVPTPPPPPAVTSNTVTIGAASFAVSGTDVYRAADKLVVYTSAGGASTPTNIYGAEAVVIGGTVTRLSDRQATGGAATAVPANGYVLSGHGAARDWLLARARVGVPVTLSTTSTPVPPTPVPPTPVPPGTVLKVMPFGDSLTQVGGTAMGFKGYLLDKLYAAGSPVDYVGSQVASGPAGLKDRDHEGHSGWQNSNFQPTAGGFVSTYKPDVVVYHVGTNDIWSNVDANTAIGRLRDVLTRIYAAKPDTHVVVAKIVRMNVGKEAQWQSYNSQIPGVVSGFAAQGRRISLADLSATLAPADLQGDGIHVTDGGHRKMADAFYPVVKAALDGLR
jgi:lysophospholipase L1-like esterase